MSRPTTVEAGRRAEARARAHLEKLGYRIVDANWRCPGGEIDLVAIDKDTLCVIEVRSRGRTDFGHPLETVDARKRARLRRAAAAYLAKKGGENRPVRFDVVAIVGETIELRRGAFE